MAVNEEGKSTLWRSPFSTPIRRNENSSQDLFQHLEKLIASTVSICRLKGSLECQTGGLITVAEELQRLVRFAVSEISRVERDMKRHKANYEDEIGCLKDQVKFLEEEKDLLKKQLPELVKTNQDGTARGEHIETEEKRLHVEESVNGFHSVAEQEDSEANLCSLLAYDDAEDPEPLLTPERTSQRKERSSPLKTTRGKARIGKSKTLKVVANSDEDADVGKDKSAVKSVKVARKIMVPSSPADDTSCDIITDGGHSTESVEEQPEVLEEEETEKEVVEFVASKEQSKSSSTHKSSKPRSRGGKTSRQKKDTADIKERLCPKSSGVDKPLESNKDEEQEKQMTEIVKKRKRGLSSRPRRKEEGKEKNNTIDPEDLVYKDKVSEPQQIIDDDDKALDEVFQKSPVSESNVNTTPRSNKKLKLSLSSEAKHKPRVDEDEPLENLGFLIDINMRISDFVNSEVKELELPPMTSRQRNDVHKLTKLYNVRGRFGNKSDNGTTMVLVKNADTRHPRAGKADALLSELSIAASKETTGTPKAKRMHVSSSEGCEDSTTAEELESGDAVGVKKGGKQKKKTRQA